MSGFDTLANCTTDHRDGWRLHNCWPWNLRPADSNLLAAGSRASKTLVPLFQDAALPKRFLKHLEDEFGEEGKDPLPYGYPFNALAPKSNLINAMQEHFASPIESFLKDYLDVYIDRRSPGPVGDPCRPEKVDWTDAARRWYKRKDEPEAVEVVYQKPRVWQMFADWLPSYHTGGKQYKYTKATFCSKPQTTPGIQISKLDGYDVFRFNLPRLRAHLKIIFSDPEPEEPPPTE